MQTFNALTHRKIIVYLGGKLAAQICDFLSYITNAVLETIQKAPKAEELPHSGLFYITKQSQAYSVYEAVGQKEFLCGN